MPPSHLGELASPAPACFFLEGSTATVPCWLALLVLGGWARPQGLSSWKRPWRPSLCEGRTLGAVAGTRPTSGRLDPREGLGWILAAWCPPCPPTEAETAGGRPNSANLRPSRHPNWRGGKSLGDGLGILWVGGGSGVLPLGGLTACRVVGGWWPWGHVSTSGRRDCGVMLPSSSALTQILPEHSSLAQVGIVTVRPWGAFTGLSAAHRPPSGLSLKAQPAAGAQLGPTS